MSFREGSGRLSLDYLRTLRHGTVEELPDADALAAWVGQLGPFGLVSAPDSEGGATQAQHLREAIRTMLDAGRGGRKCPESTREKVNAAAAGPPPMPRLSPDGTLHWHADDPIAATLSLVARDALDLVTSPLLTRVRECAGTDCGALFIDLSRPGGRRWCSMTTCGNRAKKAAWNARNEFGG